MRKKLLFGPNERVDVPDALAIHDLVDQARRSDTRGSLNLPADGPVVVRGFTCRVNPADDTQILITPGVALMRELLPDGTIEDGQLVNMEGETDETIDMSGRPAGDYGVWVRFLYRDGETRNRARWRPDLTPEREQVALMATRQIAGLSVQASTNSPGDEWMRICSAHWDGGLVAGDLIDARPLLFEGMAGGLGNPAASWSVGDFSRSDDRSTNGIKTLRQFVTAVQRRLLELSGRRKWYDAPVWGENIRSSASAVTVRVAGGEATTAHYTIDNDVPATTRVWLTMLALDGNPTGALTDPRTDVVFVPNAVNLPAPISVDCGAASITPLGSGMRQRWGGAATLTRTLGARDLFATSVAGTGYRAVYEGLTFTASTGAGALYRIRNAGDDIVFRGCTFDGRDADTMSVLVAVDAAAGGRVSFEDCRFILGDGLGQTALQIAGAATVTIFGGSFTGAGARCVSITANPVGVFSAVGTVFDGAGVAIKAVAAEGIHLVGCRYSPATTIFDAPGSMSAIAGDGAFYNASTVAQGIVSGRWLEARQNLIYFGAGRGYTLEHDGRIVTGRGSDNAVVDFVGRFLRAASGRLYLGADHLRLQKTAGNRVALLDGEGDTPVQSIMHADRLMLGNSVGNFLGLATRNTLPKVWGTIELTEATHDAPEDGDRALGANGYYMSRTVRASGVPVSVRGYYLRNNDDQTALTLTADPPVTDVQGPTNDSRPRDQAIFKVHQLGLPDANYVVVHSVTSSAAPSGDFFGATEDSVGTPLARTMSTCVWGQTANEFYIMAGIPKLAATTGGTDGFVGLNPYINTSGTLRIVFAVFAICDADTFENGGAG